MSTPIADFWKLLVESRLLTPAQCQKLAAEFGHVKGAATTGNARTLGEWLVAQNVISRYQATVLLAGRPGPFSYGDYKVYDRVAQGRWKGMFKAVHAHTGHPVLLQFLAGAATSDPHAWTVVATQAQAHCAISDGHLNRCFELVDLTAFKFLAEEDPAGSSLEDVLAARGRLPPMEACRVICHTAMGLSRLHAPGLVHGDIRPLNVWMEPNGNAKLLRDPLALVEPLNLAVADTTGQRLLKADYMAPELAQVGRVPDMLSDVYSLGCTFYALLTGRPPFAGGDVMQKIARHSAEPIQSLEQMAGVPQPMAQVVSYMMAKNPGVRYQQASQVAEALAQFLDPAQVQITATELPTQGVYENYVHHRQAALAQQPAAAPMHGSPAHGSPQASIEPSASGPSFGFSPSAGFSSNSGTALANPPVTSAVSSTPAFAASPGAVGVKKKGKKKAASDEDGGGLTTQQIQMIAGGAGGVVALILLVIFLNSGGGNKETPADPNPQVAQSGGTTPKPGGKTPTTPQGTTPRNVGPTTPTVIRTGEQFVLVDDDNRTPWAPPTSGGPISFAYIPREAQAIFQVRPSALVRSANGELLMQALGPDFAALRQMFESAAGLPMSEIDQILIGLYDNNHQIPHVACVVWLKGETPEGLLLEKWKNPKVVGAGDKRKFVGSGGWEYYIPAGGGNKVFVMGGTEQIDAVVEDMGVAPDFRRLEKLRAVSDADRHFTAIFLPNFLFYGADKMFAGSRTGLLEGIKALVGTVEEIEAAMFSMHIDENLYAEFRLDPRRITSVTALTNDYRDRWVSSIRELGVYFVKLPQNAYWNDLRVRAPGMLSEVERFARFGSEENQILINVVLPGRAGHNLVAAGELAMASLGAAGGVASGTPTGPVSKGPEGALAQKMSLSFPKRSLEEAMQLVSDELKVPVKIVGGDLQLDGITRNQSINDFEAKDKTGAEVLVALVRKANPVTTVKDASEKDQKLVFVIAPDPAKPGSEPIILITTRAAAEKNKYTLPAPFKLK